MKLTIYTAKCAGQKSNCIYPDRHDVTNVDELKEAIRFDHVCGEYRDDRRSNENFLKSDVIVMDCDNDHSEDPEEWITPERVEELLGDFSYAIAFSRNHMKEKEGRAARPKFHVYLEIEETEDAGKYAALKRGIKERFPFFDGNALDAARFIFGADTGDVIWHEGWMKIDDDISPSYEEENASSTCGSSGPITEGNRNNAMSHFAGRVLKKYGITDKAKDAFLEHAKRCDPPLEESELNTIWGSAVRFYKRTVMTQPGYVPPDEYNAEFGSLKPDDYSDIGEARVLVQEYKGELLYTDAIEFLSYDGICWRENRQKAVGAVEEFLDMQLADARAQYGDACQVLIDAGIDESIVRAGGKALEKEITDDLKDAYKEYLAAKAYYAFVMKYRNFKLKQTTIHKSITAG